MIGLPIALKKVYANITNLALSFTENRKYLNFGFFYLDFTIVVCAKMCFLGFDTNLKFNSKNIRF
jgi:hypothetical protein